MPAANNAPATQTMIELEPSLIQGLNAMQTLALTFAVTVAICCATVLVAIPSFLQFMILIVDDE